MRKWEIKYNELKNGKLDVKLQDLKPKVEGKIATKEEYKEYNKALKVKENMPKIANIIEYRDTLTKDIEKIEEGLKTLKELENGEENSRKIDKIGMIIESRMSKLLEAKESVQKQLKNTKLTDEQKKELLDKSKKIDKEIDANNEQYVKLQDVIDKKAKMEEQRPSASREELENKKNELLQKRSKCNLVGKNLVEGFSWDSIEMNLDKWKDRTLTAKKTVAKDSEKVTANSNEKIDIEEEQEENLPAKVGRFTKIKNAFTKFTNIFKNIFKPKDIDEIEEENSATDKEKVETERDEFTKYLREVAEKGYKEVSKEEAKKRLEELKKEAYKRETEKYGEEYAKKSMQIDDEER